MKQQTRYFITAGLIHNHLHHRRTLIRFLSYVQEAISFLMIITLLRSYRGNVLTYFDVDKCLWTKKITFMVFIFQYIVNKFYFVQSITYPV